MKPKLPQRTSRDIDQISRATWNQLLDCLVWAMDHPAGDGTTILNMGHGILRLGQISSSGSSGGGTGAYAGPFCIRMYREQGEDDLQIQLYDGGNLRGTVAGIITGGSRRWTIAAQTYPLKAGVMYAEVVYDPETKEYASGAYLEEEIPESGNPRRWVCRLAEVSETDGRYTINQIWQGGDIEIMGRWLS